MKNKIQYIAWTHTSKDMAKHHKQMCNKEHSVYLNEMTFDEICDLHDAGNIIARVGDKTDFVIIDIDETTVNIKQVLDYYKDNEKYHVSYSSSNNPLKYHIFVKLDEEVTVDEYKKKLADEYFKLRNDVCGRCDMMNLDGNASNFYQCFYGPSVENEYENVLEGSIRLYKWCKKDETPMIYNENKTVKKRPSMNSADYCKKNGLLTVKEDKRFDVILPSMTNGRMKLIAEGHRYTWCRMTGTKILMRIFHLNHQFNEGWTKWDFLDTAEWAFRTNVVKPNTMEDDIKSLILWLDNKWDILVSKTYEEQCETLEPYFDCSKKQYKSRAYNASVMDDLIYEHTFDSKTVLFTDKDECKEICKTLLIDYYKFIKYAEYKGKEVAFECVNEHKNKKYDCAGMNKEQFDEYCKMNNINKVTKSRLKKQYNIV